MGIIERGWKVLPHGAGGLVCGIDIADDGTMVCRNDVNNAYIWSGTTADRTNPAHQWQPLISKNSVGTSALMSLPACPYEIVLAPSRSTSLYSIFADDANNAYSYIYYSHNRGVTWTKTSKRVNRADANDGLNRYAKQKIAVDPENPDVAYVGIPPDGTKIVGSVSGNILTVTSITGSSTFGLGRINPGQTVYTGTDHTGNKGVVAAYGTGGTTGTGTNTGTYYVDSPTDQTSTTLYLFDETIPGVYKCTDGATFSAVSGLLSPGLNPGVCGIWFDRAYTRANGTIMVGGQAVSRRIIIPIAGVGIYETIDGGQTWNEIGITALGGVANVSVWSASMNYDGVYYCLTANQLWRYSGAGGTWARIDNQTNFTAVVGATWLTGASQSGAAVIADPRSGFEGYLSVCGPNGVGTGATSGNANTATASNITWTGRTGGQASVLQAASYDVEWFNHRPTAQLTCGSAQIDRNGVFWWSGSQGIWYTDAIPSYPSTAGYVLTSNSMARGTDMSVSQDILCPPGALFPVQGSQDVGILQGTFTQFPTDYHSTGHRMDADQLNYAASDPSFVVAMVDEEDISWGGDEYYGGYSRDFGRTGTWVEYTQQPGAFYQAQIVGSITSNVLTVDSISSGVGCGQIVIGMVIATSTTGFGSEKGRVASFGTGTGGTGTYNLTGGVNQSSGTTMYLAREAFTGLVVAVDHDHHIALPFGGSNTSYGFVPVYTTNATGACNWQFTDLPRVNWTRRSYLFGGQTRPLACGYGSDLGSVWAAYNDAANHCIIYKSTDSGATWTQIADITPFGSESDKGSILFTVPGYPGHLWLGTQRSSGTSGNRIYRSTDGGVNWSYVTITDSFTNCFCLGAPMTAAHYPTIYSVGWSGFAQEKYIRYSTDEGATWSVLGATGGQIDLPPNCQIDGITNLCADWFIFKRVYACMSQSSFAYYDVVPDSVVGFRSRVALR